MREKNQSGRSQQIREVTLEALDRRLNEDAVLQEVCPVGKRKAHKNILMPQAKVEAALLLLV
jgi:hypothetical protein